MKLVEMTWPAVDALSRDVPVVLPVAAVEQHGHHMPLATDTLLTEELMRRLELRFAGRVLFSPVLWFGNSEHHVDFPGTLTASPRTYLDTLSDLAAPFLRHGFRRIVFLNGHGGNDVPGRQAVFELRQKHRERRDLLLLFATYWLLGPTPQGRIAGLTQSSMGHACEWETSMMLRIHPEWVGKYRECKTVPFGNPFEPAVRGWTTRDRTVPGHIGSPQEASAEKGEALFEVFATDASAMLDRVLCWDGRSWEG